MTEITAHDTLDRLSPVPHRTLVTTYGEEIWQFFVQHHLNNWIPIAQIGKVSIHRAFYCKDFTMGRKEVDDIIRSDLVQEIANVEDCNSFCIFGNWDVFIFKTQAIRQHVVTTSFLRERQTNSSSTQELNTAKSFRLQNL